MPCRAVHLSGGRRPHAPERQTTTYPLWYSMLGYRAKGAHQAVPKPTPANLARFAEHPVVRRAINAIKNPIAGLEWKVVAGPGLDLTPDMERRAAIATNCLRAPNGDDSFRSLIEQVIDDTLTTAGAIEVKVGGDALHPLWLYPVDGSSIRLFPAWSGAPNEARYAQYTGFSGTEILLRNDQLIYIRMNPRTNTPFGLTPVEVAFNLINAFVSSFEFAQKLAGNATPSFMLDLGPNVSPEEVAAFRLYWQDSVEGQGETPIIGGASSASEGAKGAMAQVLSLANGDDSDLRLAWQQWLVRLVAIAFDLSPQKLGLETTVNRATAEEMADADDAAAIKPMARLIAEYLTREAIGRALGWYDLAFEFEGLTPEDDAAQASTFERLINAGILLPDEARQEMGLAPLPDGRGALTKTETLIQIAKARGSAAPATSTAPDADLVPAHPTTTPHGPDEQPGKHA